MPRASARYTHSVHPSAHNAAFEFHTHARQSTHQYTHIRTHTHNYSTRAHTVHIVCLQILICITYSVHWSKVVELKQFAFASARYFSKYVYTHAQRERERAHNVCRRMKKPEHTFSFYRRLFLVSTTVRSHTATAKHWTPLSVCTKFLDARNVSNSIQHTILLLLLFVVLYCAIVFVHRSVTVQLNIFT